MMTNLKYLYSKTANETYTVNWYDGPQNITATNGFTFKSEPLKGVVDITSFTDETFNETKNYYFKKYMRFDYDGIISELFLIDDIIASGITFSCDGGIIGNDYKDIKINPDSEITITIIYLIVQDGILLENQELEVDNIRFGGEYMLNVTDEVAVLPNTGDDIILASKDIYKIFSLEDFILVSNHETVDIKYRFTQDNNRTYTEWLPLNKENIASTKLNPLRFAKVEYLIKNLGSPLVLYDIILIGDFQNVSANYLKINRYGLKEDCVSGISTGGIDGGSSTGTVSGTGSNLFLTQCSSYSENTANELDKENKENNGSYWNPYESKKISELSNMLGNQVSEIFGWDVDYHLTDPDIKGIDMYLHEYTLKNIVDMKRIKVIVPDNKFPVESVIINQFNLDLFDTFEIHIMKDEFKDKFGITRRPAEDDILYICQANMLYYVKHAQAFKDVMNAATYYKIILEKYEYKANIRNGLAESKTQIDELTNNTTIEDLFGNTMKEEEKAISNKEQMKPTTIDYIRQKISSKVGYEKEEIILDDFTTVKNIYDFSDKTIKNKPVINYKKSDSLIKSDNRSFMFWFKFNNDYDYENGKISSKILNTYGINTNTKFSLLNNFENGKGYDIYYKSGNMFLELNNYKYKIEQDLLTNIWYVGVINLNQKKQVIDFNLYKRNADIEIVMVNELSYQRELVLETDTTRISELSNNGFEPISNIQQHLGTELELIKHSTETMIESIEFTINNNLRLFGSNIKYTNMRIFSDVIPQDKITNFIKENIIKDSKKLIIADNATKKITATNFYNRNWK